MNREHAAAPEPEHSLASGRGHLRHGNPSGDPHSAPRCGARNRRGAPCQAPALRGKRRCRLHGGHSTGPRTLEGLARLRAATTQHGRWSAEGQAVARWERAYRRNGWRSLRALRREGLIIHEDAHDVAPALVEAQGVAARAVIRARDVARLRAKGLL